MEGPFAKVLSGDAAAALLQTLQTQHSLAGGRLCIATDVAVALKGFKCDDTLRAVVALRNLAAPGWRMVVVGWAQGAPCHPYSSTDRGTLVHWLQNALEPPMGITTLTPDGVLKHNTLGLQALRFQGTRGCIVLLVPALPGHSAPACAVRLKYRDDSVSGARVSASQLQNMFLQLTPAAAATPPYDLPDLVTATGSLSRGERFEADEEGSYIEKKEVTRAYCSASTRAELPGKLADLLRDEKNYPFQLLQPSADGSSRDAHLYLGVSDDKDGGMVVGVPLDEDAQRLLQTNLREAVASLFPTPSGEVSVTLLCVAVPPKDAVEDSEGNIMCLPSGAATKVPLPIARRLQPGLVSLTGEASASEASEASASDMGGGPTWILAVPCELIKTLTKMGHTLTSVPALQLELLPLFVVDIHFHSSSASVPLVLFVTHKLAVGVALVWEESLVDLYPIPLWAYQRFRAFGMARIWQHCYSRRFLVMVLQPASPATVLPNDGDRPSGGDMLSMTAYAERHAHGRPILMLCLNSLKSDELFPAIDTLHRHGSAIFLALLGTQPRKLEGMLRNLRSHPDWLARRTKWQLLECMLVPETEVQPLHDVARNRRLRVPIPSLSRGADRPAVNLPQELQECLAPALVCGVCLVNLAWGLPQPNSNAIPLEKEDLRRFVTEGTPLNWNTLAQLPRSDEVARVREHLCATLQCHSNTPGNIVALQVFTQGGASTVLRQVATEICDCAWVFYLESAACRTAKLLGTLSEVAGLAVRGVQQPVVVLADDGVSLPADSAGAFRAALEVQGFSVPVVFLRVRRWWPGEALVAPADLVLSPFLSASAVVRFSAFFQTIGLHEVTAVGAGQIHLQDTVLRAVGCAPLASVVRVLASVTDDEALQILLQAAALSYCTRGRCSFPLEKVEGNIKKALQPAVDFYRLVEDNGNLVLQLRPFWALALLATHGAVSVADVQLKTRRQSGRTLLPLVERALRMLVLVGDFVSMRELVRGRIPPWIEVFQDDHRRMVAEDKERVRKMVEGLDKLLEVLYQDKPEMGAKARVALWVLLAKMERKVQTYTATVGARAAANLAAAQASVDYAEHACLLETNGFTAHETLAYARLQLAQLSGQDAEGRAKLIDQGLGTLEELHDLAKSQQKTATYRRLEAQKRKWESRLEAGDQAKGVAAAAAVSHQNNEAQPALDAVQTEDAGSGSDDACDDEDEEDEDEESSGTGMLVGRGQGREYSSAGMVPIGSSPLRGDARLLGELFPSPRQRRQQGRLPSGKWIGEANFAWPSGCCLAKGRKNERWRWKSGSSVGAILK